MSDIDFGDCYVDEAGDISPLVAVRISIGLEIMRDEGISRNMSIDILAMNLHVSQKRAQDIYDEWLNKRTH